LGAYSSSLIPSPLMESIVVRDRLLLRWDCRDMRLGMAHAVWTCVQAGLVCERSGYRAPAGGRFPRASNPPPFGLVLSLAGDVTEELEDPGADEGCG
jgi:hypothetical protein